jgi:lambda family phage tail tape measure protein
MANEVAGITLAVDVRQVQTATQSLEQFKRANEQAAQGVQSFVNAEQVAKNQARDTARYVQEQRVEFQRLQQIIDPTASKLNKLTAAAQQLDRAFEAGVVPDREFFRLGEVLETQNNALRRSASLLTEEGRAAAEEAKQKERASRQAETFLRSLQRHAEAAELTRDELNKLRAQQLGVSSEAAPYLDRISQATERNIDAFGRQSEAIRRSGLSVGQYRNAIRTLPAQITDIGTSIAGGIPLWLIAIQQGGQIKDSFGGVANTARFLLAALNPLTGVLAIVGAGLGAAALAAFNAERGIRQAREAIDQTLRLSDESARQLSRSIADIADASGKSAADIAKSFVATTDGADVAISKLIEVGYTYEEATAAVNNYKDSSDFTQVNAAIQAHLEQTNQISRAWTENVAAVGGYNNAVAQQGLINGPLQNRVEFRLLAVNELLSNTQKDANDLVIYGNQQYAKTVQAIKEQELALDGVKSSQRDLNNAQEQLRKAQRGGDQDAIRSAQNILRLRQREYDAAVKAEDRINNPRTREARKPTTREYRDETQAYESGVIALEAQLQALRSQVGVTSELSRERKALYDEQARFIVLERRNAAGTLTRAQQRTLAEKDTILALAQQKAELGDQIQEQTRVNNLARQNATTLEKINAQTASLNIGTGLSDRQRQFAQQIAQLEANQVSAGGDVNAPDFQRILQSYQAFYDAETAQREDWQAGARSAFANITEEASNYANVAGSLVTTAFNGIADQITSLVTTGQASFKEFTASILSEIAKIITRLLLVRAIEATISSFGGGAGGALGSIASSVGFASGGYTGDGGKYQAAGTVHKGEFVFTKEATSRIGVGNLYKLMRGYSNRSSSTPTSGYANGGYVTGQDGVVVNAEGITVNVNNGGDPKGVEQGVRAIIADELSKSVQQGGRIYNYVKGYG